MSSYRTSALLHLINPKYGDTLPAVVHFQTSCSIGEWMVKDDSFGRQSPSHPSHTHRAVGMYGCYLRSVPYLPYRALCTPTPSRALNHTHLTALHLHLHHTYPPPPSPFSAAHTLSACSPFAHCYVSCALSLSLFLFSHLLRRALQGHRRRCLAPFPGPGLRHHVRCLHIALMHREMQP